MPPEGKSLGAAIDEVIAALAAIDETARLTAIKAACEHLNIAMPIEAQPAHDELGSSGANEHPLIAPESGTRKIDIRSLREQKNPSSAIEMASVVAYYLQHAPVEERKSEITAADVEKYFVQANFPLPKRSDQLLVNAKAAGYFDSASRGAYRLNAVGHNLVAHALPRKGQAQTVPASRSSKRKTTKRRQGKRGK